MNPAEFDSFVARLQQDAQSNPAAYRLRVLGLAVLGYGYLAALVLVLLALFVLTLVSIAELHALGVKLAFIVGGFFLIVLRSLWVRLEAPTGVPVHRADAPALFHLLDRLQRSLRTPRVDRVLVTGEFNAGVVQLPRLGLFGWHRNYLLLGLPLMQVLTPSQFEAVLAHELGHLAGGHGRTGNWIYRLRLMWLRLNAALTQSEHWGSFAVRRFFNWYVPYFHAYSFPLARANEYEADAASVRFASARSAAQALAAVNVVGAFLERRFWPGVYAQAADRSQPAFAPFSAVFGAVTQDIEPVQKEKWLAEALARETSAADTHPALKDRLRAIGAPAELALPEKDKAADTLFGAARVILESRLNEAWTRAVGPAWEQRHQEIAKGRGRLAELVAKAGNAALNEDDALERATLEEHVGAGRVAALEQRRALHALRPDSAPVCFALGRQLVQDGDESGVALLEKAIERDPAAVAAASELLRDFFWQRGEKRAAYHWQRRLELELPRLEAARRERNRLTLKDRLDPHGLEAESIARLREQLGRLHAVRRAYLVRKELPARDDAPMFVLGFSITAGWQLHRASKAAAVQKRIIETCEFPGQTLIISVDGNNHRFGRKLRRLRGARIL